MKEGLVWMGKDESRWYWHWSWRQWAFGPSFDFEERPVYLALYIGPFMISVKIWDADA